MASINKQAWTRNLFGAIGPLIMLGRFVAGATQAIKRGEILELVSGDFEPLTSDKAMAGIVAIANEEIKSGDRAGFYEIIVPRPGDVFRYAIASEAILQGVPIAISDAQKVTSTVTNVLGDIVDQDHFPLKQGHLSDDASGDSGLTIRATTEVGISIKESNSIWATFQQ